VVMRMGFLGRLLAVFAAFAALSASAAAQPADFRQRATAILEAGYPADGPGASVVVMRHGRIIFATGRGLADLATRRPITPDTIFRYGSITKQFTAAIILQLVSEGRIALDDPISRFFPDFPQPGAHATVRQLLNHTSGIQSYTGIPGWMVEENTNHAYTTEQMIAQFRDRPSPTLPGQAWAYNNSGYVLLGAIIEKVTGHPWHQAVVERIARPLGLRSIGYGVTGEANPAMARGYTQVDGRQQPAPRIHLSVPHAAGALIGTAGDLARWAQALHHGRIVPAALYQQMIAPTRLPDGTTRPYGFGLESEEFRGRHAIGHNGGIFGFSTDSLYIPADDLFVAVLTNSDEPPTHPSLTLRRIAALAIGDPFPEFTSQPIDAASLEPLFGVYRVSDTVNRRFFARDGKLYTHRDGAPPLEAFAAGGGRFFYGPGSLNWFEIKRQPDGAIVMEMHQGGANQGEIAMRSGPIPVETAVTVDPAVLRSYVGAYATPGPVATIALSEAGQLTVQLSGQGPMPLQAISATEFRVEGGAATILFHNENGQVNRLTIRQGAREIEGRRTGG
jgi:D-alanyl-D-alanine carboxypeptidase